MVLDWLEKQVPPNEDLLHKWSMSFVRMLSAPAPTSSLIAKVRLHESQGVYKKARLLLASSSLRSGATLLGEALAIVAISSVDSRLETRCDRQRPRAAMKCAFAAVGGLSVVLLKTKISIVSR